MAITIIDDTLPVVPVLNPAFLRLSTDAMITTEAVYPKVTLEFLLTGPNATEVIEFENDLMGSITFTAIASSGTPTNTQFRIKSVGQTIDEWIDQTLVPDLKANHVFTTYFEVMGTEIPGPGKILIRSRTFDDITIPTNTLSNTITTIDNTQTQEVREPNFTVILEILLEKQYLSTAYEVVATLQLNPDDAQRIDNVDLSPHLEPYLSSDLPFFNLSDPSLARSVNAIKRFYYRYAERFGDPPATGDFTSSTLRHAWLAGIPLHKLDTELSTYVNSNPNKFLTWQSRTNPKVVTPTEHQFLYWLNQRDESHETFFPRVMADIYFTNGDTLLNQQLIAATDSNAIRKHRIAIVPAGYTQLDIGSIDPSKVVQRYEVWLEFPGDPIITLTEKFPFIVDYTNHPQSYTFAIPNSLGGLDWISTHGESILTLNNEKESILVDDFRARQVTEALLKEYANDSFTSFSVPICFGTKDEADRARDWLLSRKQAWIVGSDSYIPISINPGQVSPVSDQPGVYQVDIQFRHAFNDNNYGKL